LNLYSPQQTASIYSTGESFQSDAFAYVRVHIDYHLTHTVMWQLKSSVTDRYGLFDVEISSGDAFTPIMERVDSCFTTIPQDKIPLRNRERQKIRVRYKGQYGEYLSKPIPLAMVTDKKDRGYASEMYRRQYLTLKSYSGVQGQLLKKRDTGLPCSRCVDLVTGAPANYNCPECFGTGLTGGYYPGVWCYMEIRTAPNTTTVNTQAIGVITPGDATIALTVHEHWIEKDDIWVSGNTGVRYVIQEISPATVYKDMVISVQISMRKEDISAPSVKGAALNDTIPSNIPVAFVE
jgi:hypothetical protein